MTHWLCADLCFYCAYCGSLFAVQCYVQAFVRTTCL